MKTSSTVSSTPDAAAAAAAAEINAETAAYCYWLVSDADDVLLGSDWL